MQQRRPRTELDRTSLLFRYVRIGCVYLSGVSPLPMAQAPEQMQARGCVEIHGRLPTSDSLVVALTHATCGHVRLVLALQDTGPSRRHPLRISIENISDTPLGLPITIAVDSLVAVDRGYQVKSFMRQPVAYTFDSAARFTVSASGGNVLRPGERSAPIVLSILNAAVAQEFRLWLNVVELPLSPVQPVWVMDAPRDSGPPVSAAVDSFVAAANLPLVQRARVIYWQPDHDLYVFRVNYGPQQDCLSGCFYEDVIGLSYRGRIGWLEDVGGYGTWFGLQPPHFTFTRDDPYLLSATFIDRVMTENAVTVLTPDAGQRGTVEERLLQGVLQSPDLPRDLALWFINRCYAGNTRGASMVLSHPVAKLDPELLTLVANLPLPPSEAQDLAERARRYLRALAPSLVHDSSASTMTLFVVAQTLHDGILDSTLTMAIADLPKARSNLAILMTLAGAVQTLTPRVVATVRASDRVKAMLARYLSASSRGAGQTKPPPAMASNVGWDLLADPEAAVNQDVLTVLANSSADTQNLNVAWAASRLLPASSLRRWEPIYVPIHEP